MDKTKWTPTVFDFCVEFGRQMILCGANLERVQVEIDRIAHAYEIEDHSLYLLSSFLSMAGREKDGTYVSREVSILPMNIHLDRLKRLNSMYYRVIEETPPPEILMKWLEEAKDAKEYPWWVVNLAQIAALCCVAMMFGGRISEVISMIFIVFGLQVLIQLMKWPGLDRIVVNATLMFAATTMGYFIFTDYSLNFPIILITASIMLIPGIPMVNAARNLLCGNEMNGILQVFKVTIETLSLAAGIVIAIWLFDIPEVMQNVVVDGPTSALYLIVLSFLVSFFNGITFKITPRDLFFAGIGGALSRVVLILVPAATRNPLLIATIAALVAASYAEILANKRSTPSTYFIYPSILPMIPGGSFYYAIIGIYSGDRAMFLLNGKECLLTLCGMSIGFVLSSIIAHYIRKVRHTHLTIDRAVT